MGNTLKEILKNELKENETFLENHKEGIINIIKNIGISKDGYDWTLFDFHHYNIVATTGKIILLKKLLNKIKEEK